MYTINANYLKLQGSYLFSTIAKKVHEYKENNKDAEIIRLGIGDVTKPIAPDIIYLCFHNNPTGMAITRDALQEWEDLP